MASALLSSAVPGIVPGLVESAMAQQNGLDGPNGIGAKEAPMLTELVKAGKLPPLAKRLPDSPLVVTPVEIASGSMAASGGRRSAARLDSAWLYRTIGYDQLTRWGWQVDASEPVANLAESIELLDDAKRFIIHLRKGVRWSDGEPFTTADLMFAYDDVLRNEQPLSVAAVLADLRRQAGGLQGRATTTRWR